MSNIEEKIEDICNHAGDYTYHTLHETLHDLLALSRKELVGVVEKKAQEKLEVLKAAGIEARTISGKVPILFEKEEIITLIEGEK